jgi:Protein of unknown function (DUF3450)
MNKTRGVRSACVVTAAAIACAVCSTVSAQDTPTDLGLLIQQWTGLERQKDELKNRWRTQQPVLEQRLTLLGREQDELEQVIEQNESTLDEVEQKRQELLEQQTKMEREQDVVQRRLREIVAGIRNIYPQLPPPMAEVWQKDIDSLDSTQLTASERLQKAVEMLSALADFDAKLTLNEAPVLLDDGSEYFVRQVYVGLSRGWYVGLDGKRAAYGYSTLDGWRWEPLDAADDVASIIAILERREPAALVSMSMDLTAEPEVGSR